jgi:hypothetical protein
MGVMSCVAQPHTGLRLPFAVAQLVEDGKELEFSCEEGFVWRRCLSDYVCIQQARGHDQAAAGIYQPLDARRVSVDFR